MSVSPHRDRRTLRVVALGGGTGLPVVLRGMKQLLHLEGDDERERLAAIVTVTDDGGSSGRLRDELGILPPGDVRNCLVALSHDEPLMSRVFQARYTSGKSLHGHSLGNLILAGLTQMEGGSFLSAIGVASDVLNIHGKVFPSTLETACLVGSFVDGRTVRGESAITGAGGTLEGIGLDPDRPDATPGVVEAIESADLVVLGPGSLFTSIVPNLLIPEVRRALRETAAFRLLVVNAMTECGETTAFSAADHVRVFDRHAGEGALDAVLLASDRIPEATLARYRAENAQRVDPSDGEIESLVPSVFRKEVLEITEKVRHDATKTAEAILSCRDEWVAAGSPKGGAASSRDGHDDATGSGGRAMGLISVERGARASDAQPVL